MDVNYDIGTQPADVPAPTKSTAEEWVEAVMAKAAGEVVSNVWRWRKYVDASLLSKPSEAVDAQQPTFWDNVPDKFRSVVVRVSGRSLYRNLLSLADRSKFVAMGRGAITVARAEDAVREAIDNEIALTNAGGSRDSSSGSGKLEEPVGSIHVDIGSPNENVPSVTYGKALAINVREDLFKATTLKEHKMSDFLPDRPEEFELFKSHRIVPRGFLTQDQVKEVCPTCATEMRKAGIPLIRFTRFVSDMARRVVLDAQSNADAWAKVILEDAPEMVEGFAKASDASAYDLTKGCSYAMGVRALQRASAGRKKKTKKTADESFTVRERKLGASGKSFLRVSKSDFIDMVKGRRSGALEEEAPAEPKLSGKPTLADFVKAHPQAAISGWAEKMKAEGGEHPHTWCSRHARKFASDPDAFCAAVHMEAFGKMPAKKG